MQIRTQAITVMPIQSPPGRKIPLDLRRSIKRGDDTGIICVVPAGNFGPLIGTLSPLARVNNVISVGGASNDGKKLMSFSSRGIPNKTGDRPTIVAPSEDIIGITHSGITPVLLQQKKLKHLLNADNYFEQWGYRPTTHELKEYEHKFVIGTGTSQSCELVGHMIVRIISFRQGNNLRISPKIIRRILCDAAVEMDGYQSHEVGNGFLSFFVLDKYLRAIANRDFPSKLSRELWGESFSLEKYVKNKVVLNHMDNTRYDIKNFTDEPELLNPLLQTGKSPFDEDFGNEFSKEELDKLCEEDSTEYGI
jgi:hypothetical protein